MARLEYVVCSASDPGLAVAVAAQIGEDHAVGGRERRGDVVPDHMGLRIAVQEQDGRPVPGGAHVDSHTLDVKGAAVEVAQ